MNQLREITNSTINVPTSTNEKSQPSANQQQSITELIALNTYKDIDFKQCIPGTVHQKKLAITLKEQQPVARIISMVIVCQDETLNELPEYIFGVRKENAYEYFDQFRFKAIQKGTYNFIVGVKTPNFTDYLVKAKLYLSVQGIKDVYELELKQQIVVPFVRCTKQLVSEQGFRMIKLATIKNKSKKQTKLVFRCSENINLTLLAEIIGLEDEGGNQVEVKPKMTQTGGKGMFLITVATNCPQNLKQKMTLRRVLVLKIKDTSCHFHFPMQIAFYPEGQQGVILQS